MTFSINEMFYEASEDEKLIQQDARGPWDSRVISKRSISYVASLVLCFFHLFSFLHL